MPRPVGARRPVWLLVKSQAEHGNEDAGMTAAKAIYTWSGSARIKL